MQNFFNSALHTIFLKFVLKSFIKSEYDIDEIKKIMDFYGQSQIKRAKINHHMYSCFVYGYFSKLHLKDNPEKIKLKSYFRQFGL